MKLKNLSLENFRNYRKHAVDFDLSRSVNYIVGPNAQGKTNLLEAIYLLALTKSFRGQKMAELINWDCEYARVTETFQRPTSVDVGRQLEIFLGKPPHPQKVLKKNGVKTSAENFLGNLKVVFFHPEDLNILYLGPDLRRRYLDILIIQENPAYYRALRSYKKTLEHRNALLRAVRENLNSPAELDIWDAQLVDFGGQIIAARMDAVEYLKEGLKTAYHQISQGEEVIEMSYKVSGLAGQDEDSRDGTYSRYKSHIGNEHHIGAQFLATLQKNRRRDIEAGITTSGPHRDDLIISLSGRPLYEHASRGEYRSIVLALKMLEMDYHYRISGTRPVVLLDDVFSELDDARRSMLVSAIQEHQVFITSTKVGEHFIERTHRSLHEPAREPNIIRVGVE